MATCPRLGSEHELTTLKSDSCKPTENAYPLPMDHSTEFGGMPFCITLILCQPWRNYFGFWPPRVLPCLLDPGARTLFYVGYEKEFSIPVKSVIPTKSPSAKNTLVFCEAFFPK